MGKEGVTLRQELRKTVDNTAPKAHNEQGTVQSQQDQNLGPLTTPMPALLGQPDQRSCESVKGNTDVVLSVTTPTPPATMDQRSSKAVCACYPLVGCFTS